MIIFIYYFLDLFLLLKVIQMSPFFPLMPLHPTPVPSPALYPTFLWVHGLCIYIYMVDFRLLFSNTLRKIKLLFIDL